MTPTSRNAPCPCGSGKRFKHCHGLVQAPRAAEVAPARSDAVAAALRRARHCLEDGDVDGAQQACRDALATAPDDPALLCALARCHHERGDPDAALPPLLRAARSLVAHPMAPRLQHALWARLNFLFGAALAGHDTAFARAKRREYEAWYRARGDDAGAATPQVGIVVVAPANARALAAALRSVAAQTYPRLNVVVALGGADPNPEGEARAALAAFPFPARVLHLPGRAEPMLAEAGVRAVRGEYVNLLGADDLFAPTRIATMVERIARRGLGWGFAAAGFVDADGRALGPDADPRVAAAERLFAGIPEQHTVGHALIDERFVPVAAGNLFCSRALYEAVQGVRDRPHAYAWDFALRALWHDEPEFVPSREFLHRLADAGAGAPPGTALQHAAIVAMFADYYARARGDAVSPNPYAPSFANWRLAFAKHAFHAGHIQVLRIDDLERFAAAAAAGAARPVTAARALSPGLNLVGLPYGEFGFGTSLRAFAGACAAGGIPFVVNDADMYLASRQADRSIERWIDAEARHSCSVLCVSPRMLKRAPYLMRRASVERVVGYWFWELEHIPPEWASAIAGVDEIWSASEFICAAFRRATDKPVVNIPHPIVADPSRVYERREFGLPDDRFLFLFSFDFISGVARKNPEGTIAAFRRAFTDRRADVGLVVKSVNGDTLPAELRRLHELAGGDERIVILDRYLNRDEVLGLQSVADAFVSLHRAEGLGLGLAEAMYQGKPAIATAFSGNLEFMDRDNSCLVDFARVPIRPGEFLHADERSVWAEPDIDHAAACMRRVADDADYRRAIAARGQHDVRTRFSYERTAAAVRDRLTALGLMH